MNSSLCEVCGRPLPKRKSGQRGRPRAYHETCKRFNDLLGWITQQAEAIDFTPAKAMAWRSELWLIGNTIKTSSPDAGRLAFGVRVREARVAKALSQAELGLLVGVAARRIGKIEAGEAALKAAEKAALKAGLGLWA